MDAVGVLEIFLLMLFSALFSFGGGNGAIPLIQGRWIEPGHLAPELFSFSLAITYLAPGPRAGFLAGVGYYLDGLPGAAAAMLGVIAPTVVGAGAVSLALGPMQRILRQLKPSSGFVIAASSLQPPGESQSPCTCSRPRCSPSPRSRSWSHGGTSNR